MKKRFWMECHAVMDAVYKSEKDSLFPFLSQLRIGLHLLLCPRCSGELENLRRLEEIMKTDFFPDSPDFEEAIMERLYGEIGVERQIDAPAGFSFRFWVITGFFVLLSLSSSFFGMDFVGIADSEGLSFLLPLGLTIGMVVTCYGALFIGSHIKELSSRFGLH